MVRITHTFAASTLEGAEFIVCVCVCACVYVYTCTYMHTYIHIYTHICMKYSWRFSEKPYFSGFLGLRVQKDGKVLVCTELDIDLHNWTSCFQQLKEEFLKIMT